MAEQIKVPPLEPEFTDPGRFSRIQDRALFGKDNEVPLVNHDGEDTAVLIGDKTVNVAPSVWTSLKVDGKSQQIISKSFEEDIITNKLHIEADEIVVNHHQLNPVFYKYTDFKYYNDQYGGKHIVGDLCVDGTVLVKAWDEQLRRYVLMRRPGRFQMFAPMLNVPSIHKGLEIEDKSEAMFNQKATQTQSLSADDWWESVKKLNKKESQSPQTGGGGGNISTQPNGGTGGDIPNTDTSTDKNKTDTTQKQDKQEDISIKPEDAIQNLID